MVPAQNPASHGVIQSCSCYVSRRDVFQWDADRSCEANKEHDKKTHVVNLPLARDWSKAQTFRTVGCLHWVTASQNFIFVRNLARLVECRTQKNYCRGGSSPISSVEAFGSRNNNHLWSSYICFHFAVILLSFAFILLSLAFNRLSFCCPFSGS